MDRPNPSTIGIRLAGSPSDPALVPASVFLKSSQGMVELLTQIARDEGSDRSMDWYIGAVRPGSVQMNVVGIPRNEDSFEKTVRVMDKAFNGLAKLETSQPTRGELSLKAIEKARIVLSAIKENQGGISISHEGKVLELNAAMVETTNQILNKKFDSIGSAEGLLETISVHDNRPYFTLYHILDQYAIRCWCSDPMIDLAKDHLRERVLVVGDVRKSAVGKVETIDVREIRTFKPKDILPSIRESQGILSKKD